MALFQHDMAGVFPPFSELKEGVLPKPRRVGSPMRRGVPQHDIAHSQHDVAGAQLTPRPQPCRLPLRCG